MELMRSGGGGTQDSKHESAMASIKVLSVGSMRPKGKSYDIEVFQASVQGKQQNIYIRSYNSGVHDEVCVVVSQLRVEQILSFDALGH